MNAKSETQGNPVRELGRGLLPEEGGGMTMEVGRKLGTIPKVEQSKLQGRRA